MESNLPTEGTDVAFGVRESGFLDEYPRLRCGRSGSLRYAAA
jgi:hypothetical protein